MQYVKDKKFSYLHFCGCRIGLAPLFRQGINTPCIAKLLIDIRHLSYEHARIGTIVGNLSKGCQYGTIYPDYAISLIDKNLKDCWKLMVGIQGVAMAAESEYLSVIIQNSFQLTNTVHPKLKQPVLRDCVTVGLTNADVEGVCYDEIGLPSDWYFQYKAIANDPHKSKAKRIAADNGQVRIIPDLPDEQKPKLKPRRVSLPPPQRENSGFSSSIPRNPQACTLEEYEQVRQKVVQSPQTSDLYIPDSKPFLTSNKMFRTRTPFEAVDEW